MTSSNVMQNLKLGSLFAGIGGIDLGFKLAGVTPVWANEIDKSSAQTYLLNHEADLVIDDIKNINARNMPNVDILAGGFPCQPFSIAGYKLGFDDDRGTLFFQIVRLIEEMKNNKTQPKIIFLENVKNLLNHDHGETYIKMKNELKKLGYFVTEKILNTCLYGNIPQNRERLYIIGFLDEKHFDNFKWPEKIDLKSNLRDFVNYKDNVESKYYYTKESKYYDKLATEMINNSSIYQLRRVYIRENKSGVCPALTANMGMGGHNVPLILDDNSKIRKLTPKECLLLQGFPSDFKLPQQADSKIYKQAGNSVSVPVIKRIAEAILAAME